MGRQADRYSFRLGPLSTLSVGRAREYWGGATLPTIYVLAHGWTPGYRAAVNSQAGNLLWWGANASVKGVWSSDWAWSPVVAPLSPTFPVNSTGLLQSIVALDPTAVVLAYSWIDDSATKSGSSRYSVS